MRILVLTPTFLPALGGAELVILNVYRRIASKHSVRILTPYLPDSLIDKNGSNEYDNYVNFEVVHYRDRLTFMKIRGHKITCGIIPPFSLSGVRAIQREIRIFHPDVINVHYVMPTGLAGLYAQKIRKIPVVITYNGRDVPGPGVPPLWKYWHRLMGSNCSAMTFVSEYCREAIYGTGFKQGHVIYNGVEEPATVSTTLKRKIKSRLNLKENERVLFALQRLDPLKRVDVLIQSMPRILQRFPNTRLIIGGKGPEQTRLKNIANDLNVAEHVHFTGFITQNELPIYFTLADLFVFHSTYETFGMVLAEAMNFRKAIVSVSNTAISEVVDDGKTGLLVPTLDYEALADAVLKLLNDEERRNEMGRNGYKKSQKFFKWNAIASQYEKVLNLAINNESKLK
jgi:glycosyltransferase involved in cell wall biosynthesis